MSMAVSAMLMLPVVMGTHSVGVILEVMGQQGLHLGIRISLGAGVKLNAGLSQRRSRSSADSAADKDAHTLALQKPSQRTVAAAVGIHHLAAYYRTILYLVDFKLLGVSKVLKNLSVFKSNCNFHLKASLIDRLVTPRFYRFFCPYFSFIFVICQYLF